MEQENQAAEVNNQNGVDAGNAPQFAIGGQYIKDLSFESPNAPHSVYGITEKPTIDLNVDLNAQKLQDDTFEVSMKINAKATVGENKDVVFVTELDYAGIFALKNIPEEVLERTLLVDCPFILFPYARRVISDATRDGGFPPLSLEPIDFASLYIRRKQQQQEGAGEAAKSE